MVDFLSMNSTTCRIDEFIHLHSDSSFDEKSIHSTVLLTSACYPFHIEWVNAAWSKLCGWSSEEVVGLDCKFMQGEATQKAEVAKFMNCLIKNGGCSSMTVCNYRKDGAMMRCRVQCMPLMDIVGEAEEGSEQKLRVSHIGVEVSETLEVEMALPHSPSDSYNLDGGDFSLEVGMPLDRRENCNAYGKCGDLPPPSLPHWRRMTSHFATSLMLRYMLRSQAPIVLIDSTEGKIVHMNVSFCFLACIKSMSHTGLQLTDLFGQSTDEDKAAVEQFNSIISAIALCHRPGDKAHPPHSFDTEEFPSERGPWDVDVSLRITGRDSSSSHNSSSTYNSRLNTLVGSNTTSSKLSPRERRSSFGSTVSLESNSIKTDGFPSPRSPRSPRLSPRMPYYEEKTVPMIASPVAVGSSFIAVLFSFLPPKMSPREAASKSSTALPSDNHSETVNTMSFSIKTNKLFAADTA